MSDLNGIERRNNFHDCKHTAGFAELKRDMADVSVDVSSLKELVYKQTIEIALMAQAMKHLAETVSNDIAEEKSTNKEHREDGKTWRTLIVATALGSLGGFAGVIYGYGKLASSVDQAQKYIDSRTFGALEVDNEKKA